MLVLVVIRNLLSIDLYLCFRIRTDGDTWFGPSRVRVKQNGPERQALTGRTLVPSPEAARANVPLAVVL